MTLVAQPSLPLAAGVDAQNPWPGLVAFTEELQEFFHGRAEEADELLRRVKRKDLTVLFGQSGLGKSSLLQAGLFPRLRAEGYLPVALRLDHAATAPPLSEQVKGAIALAIRDAGGRSEPDGPQAGGPVGVGPGPQAGLVRPGEAPGADEASDTLWEHFHRRGLCPPTGAGQPVRLVLVFDQFEELFAIGQANGDTRSRAALFLTELADLIENRAPEALERRLEEDRALARHFNFDDHDHRTLLCLREDYLPHLESLRQLMPSVTENRMRLTRMDGPRALEAVLNPGQHLVTEEVGRQIVRFVAGDRRATERPNGQGPGDALANLEAEPSLLSLLCRELNNRRLGLGMSQITADLLAGSREDILQDFYERCMADQPPAVRAFVEDELVTDSGLRENMALERARKALTQRGAPAAAIDELVKRRLLHLEERLAVQRVELTHDVLTRVVKKSRDERQKQQAKQSAQETREKARRQRKRLLFIVAAMAVGLLVVTGLGALSYHLYRVSEKHRLEAERAREEALKEKSQAEKAREQLEQVIRDATKKLTGTYVLMKFLGNLALSNTGTKVKEDVKRSNLRGRKAFQQGRYRDALPDLKKASEPGEAHADDYEILGRCYGKLGRWDEAIKAYTRAIDLALESETHVVCNLLQTLIIAERPDQLLQFVQSVEKRGWILPKEGARAAEYTALYHGFRVMALRMSGKDASDAERATLQITRKSGFKITGWTWDELDQWLKTTKLTPDRKTAVEKVIAELQGRSKL
jgi:tetratricopeptide (TPR) repeat protein